MLGDMTKPKVRRASDCGGDTASGLTPLQASKMAEVKVNGQGRLLASSLSIHGMHLAAVSGDKVKMTSYLAVGPQFLEIRDRLGRTPLIYAVFGDKENAVDFLLKAGAKIESHDMFGRTALHYVAHKDRGQSLKAIMCRVGSGESLVRALNWHDGEGSTPIHLATKHPGCKILGIFLKKMSAEAAHVDIQDHAKRTPLHWACLHGNAKAVGMLLSHGANGGISDVEGKTPLHWACEHHPEASSNAKDKDAVKCITLILEKCPTLMNWQDFNGQTCLHAAAMNPSPEIMTALLSKIKTSGSKFRSVSPAMNLSDHGHRTALHWACALGHAGAARALLNSGADPVATDVVGARPLHYAALNGHMECVKLLVEQNQSIDATDQDGNTALHWATTAEEAVSREPQNVAIMAFLLQSGANLNAVNNFGLNALHVAASFGETNAVKFLAGKGLSVDGCSEGSGGLTPLMLACQHGHTETGEALISLGARLETRDTGNGRSAVHHVAATGNLTLMRLLVSKGCDINSKDSLGQTAAHVLALGGFCDPLAYLIKRPGFELDPQDDYGLTPMHCAAGKGHLRAVELLVDAGAKINLLSWLPDRPTALDLSAWNNHPVVSEYLLSKNASSAAPILEEKARTLQNWYRRKIKDQPSKFPERPVMNARLKQSESNSSVLPSKPPLKKLGSDASSRVSSVAHDLDAIEPRKFADFSVPKRFESVKFAPRQSLRKTSEDTAAFVMRSVAKTKGFSGGAGSGGDPPWNFRPVVDRLPSWRTRTEPDNVEWNVPCVAGCGSSQGAWNCISTMMLKCAIAAVFDLPSDQEDDFYGMDNALRNNQDQETTVTMDEASEEAEPTRLDSSEALRDE